MYVKPHVFGKNVQISAICFIYELPIWIYR